jgi:glycine/D-amino acid oxidase-like deaminating enzyme
MGRTDYDAAIVGGGIIGCCLALYLKNHMDKVVILEREAGILRRASYANQARVHNGYHYPRSFLTALRSKVNFPRFVAEYEECIDKSFDQYYAIGKFFSNVNAIQFKAFCKRIHAPLEPAPRGVKGLFNDSLVEDVFLAQEHAFDAVKLRDQLLTSLMRKNIELRTRCNVRTLSESSDGLLRINCQGADRSDEIKAKHVFNCTYSQMNQILLASGLPAIPLKQELTEIALVEAPKPLSKIGVTIMCGPFFSIMPFPPLQLHSLSHVRYTPHHTWHDNEGGDYHNADDSLRSGPRVSNYRHMINDAQRYLPALKDCRYVDSLWEVKTILPRSAVDDSRPILFRKHHAVKNLFCILGGKIDNIYDILDEVEAFRLRGDLN